MSLLDVERTAAATTAGQAAVDARRLGQAENHDTLRARNTRLSPGDPLKLKVRRSEAGQESADYQQFEVPYQKSMRVLDALNWIAENAATDLAAVVLRPHFEHIHFPFLTKESGRRSDCCARRRRRRMRDINCHADG